MRNVDEHMIRLQLKETKGLRGEKGEKGEKGDSGDKCAVLYNGAQRLTDGQQAQARANIGAASAAALAALGLSVVDGALCMIYKVED